MSTRSRDLTRSGTDALFAARKPVDPPPIIEVTVREAADPVRYGILVVSPVLSCDTDLEMQAILAESVPVHDVQSSRGRRGLRRCARDR